MGYMRNNIHLEAMKKHHEERDALKQAIGKKLIHEKEKQLCRKMNKTEREVIMQGGRDYKRKILNYKKFCETNMSCVYGYVVVNYNERRVLTYPFFFETFEKAFDYVMQETEKFLEKDERQEVQIDFKENGDSLIGAVITDFRYTPYRSSIITDCHTYTITNIIFAPNYYDTFLIPSNILYNKEFKIHEF